MQNLNEAVIKLINEDVMGGKKLIENELYDRLGSLLEEKLKSYAPTIFTESKDYDGDGEKESSTEEWKGSRDKAIKASKGNKKPVQMEDVEAEDEDDLIMEDYQYIVEELEQLVEEIESETGEELSESEIEELADILLESMDGDPDEEEDFEEDEEDFEEDFEEETE